MTLEPLLAASPAIRIHVAAVVPAFAIGTWQIFASRKGAAAHRIVGFAYLGLMTMAALRALFIHRLMPRAPLGLSPIHLLIPLTLFGIFGALRGAATRNLAMHRWSMIGVYAGGLLIAGTLAFLPGRIMHQVVFGP
ncbi:MAG: DUF2306 domain-containing protein [Candidatus Dormibacteria bacterium]